MKSLGQDSPVPAEIRTEYPPNKNLEYYHYDIQLDAVLSDRSLPSFQEDGLRPFSGYKIEPFILRSYLSFISFVCDNNYNDQVKKGQMGSACSTYGGEKECI
jgi:hypothetical protein